MLDFQTRKCPLTHIPDEGTEAWRDLKYLPRATELESGQMNPSLSRSKVCVLFVTESGQSGSPRTPQSWWGWEGPCSLSKSDSSIFLGQPPGLWGQEECLKQPCCPLDFGLVPYALDNEPSWPLAPTSGASLQELGM